MPKIRRTDRSTAASPAASTAPGPAPSAQASESVAASASPAIARDSFGAARAGSPQISAETARDAALDARVARRLAAADDRIGEKTQDLLDKGFRAVQQTLGKPAALELGAASALGFLVLAAPAALVAGTVGAAVNGILGGMPERYLDRLADKMDQAGGQP